MNAPATSDRPAKVHCPFAAHSEAIADARGAGYWPSEIDALIAMGESFALFGIQAAPQLMTLTDARSVESVHVSGGLRIHEVRPVSFSGHSIMHTLIDAMDGQLAPPALHLIRTAANLYLRQSMLVRREASK